MLAKKRSEISGAANRLRNGLQKIQDTQEKVEVMSEELKVNQEQVIAFQAECDNFILNIKKETAESDVQKLNVEEQKQRIAVEEAEIVEVAKVAKKDLEKAMPALNAAEEALNSLNKNDLTEVKSYATPPEKVQRVMEAVMVLLGRDTSWAESKRALGESSFLDQLKGYDKNHINDKTLKRIERYTKDSELEPNKVGVVSFACKSLILWVRAIERYGKIYKLEIFYFFKYFCEFNFPCRVVGPKIEAVAELEESLRQKQEQLAQAQRKLQELAELLDKLRRDYEEKAAMREKLRQKSEHLRLQLERAFMLVDGLSGERLRWIETVKRLDGEFLNLPGDCLVSTAFISYLGPFVTTYREKLVSQWTKEVTTNKIPASNDFIIWNFLSNPSAIRQWNIQGLPSDGFSTENGIIVTNGSRWPLVIDPQCQAQKWIKRMEQQNDLQIIDFGQTDYIKTLEMALQFGKPVLLQNVMETLDPVLAPILNRSIIKQGGQLLIKFNDKTISYDTKFR